MSWLATLLEHQRDPSTFLRSDVQHRYKLAAAEREAVGSKEQASQRYLKGSMRNCLAPG